MLENFETSVSELYQAVALVLEVQTMKLKILKIVMFSYLVLDNTVPHLQAI